MCICLNVCMYTMCVSKFLNWPEGGIRYPGAVELSYCCELPVGCWKPNLCPLKENKCS